MRLRSIALSMLALVFSTGALAQGSKDVRLRKLIFESGSNTLTLQPGSLSSSASYSFPQPSAGLFQSNGSGVISMLSPAGTGVLYSNGSSWSASSFASLGVIQQNLALPLTANYLMRWNGTYAADALIYDNGSNVGVGTATPSGLFSVGSGATSPFTVTNSGSVTALTFRATAPTNQIALGTTNTTTISASAPSSSRVYTLPDAGGAASFILSTSSAGQTIAAGLTVNGGLTLGTALTTSNGGTGVTAAGSSGNLLASNGSVWVSSSPASLNLLLQSSLTTNLVPKYNGSALTNSQIFDNGTNVGVGTLTPSGLFSVGSGATSPFTVTNAGAVTAATYRSTAATNQITLGATNTTTISAVAPAGSRVYSLPDAGGNANIILSTSSSGQTIASGLTVNGGLTLGTALSVSNGGTGVTASGSSGNLLGSNGSSWVSGTPASFNLLQQVSLSTNTLPKYNGSALANSLVIDNGTTVAIGNASPNASALFELASTSKGFLAPRMTHAQRSAISSPAEGLFVYCTDSTKGYYHYDGGQWSPVYTGSSLVIVYKANDQTVTNTNLVNDNDLKIPMRAGEVWQISGMYMDSCKDGGADFKYAYYLPANAQLALSVGGTGGTSAVDAPNTSYTETRGANQKAITIVSGIVIMGNTSGDFRLQWCQKVNKAEPIYMKKGSFLQGIRLR